MLQSDVFGVNDAIYTWRLAGLVYGFVIPTRFYFCKISVFVYVLHLGNVLILLSAIMRIMGAAILLENGGKCKMADGSHFLMAYA